MVVLMVSRNWMILVVVLSFGAVFVMAFGQQKLDAMQAMSITTSKGVLPITDLVSCKQALIAAYEDYNARILDMDSGYTKCVADNESFIGADRNWELMYNEALAANKEWERKWSDSVRLSNANMEGYKRLVDGFIDTLYFYENGARYKLQGLVGGDSNEDELIRKIMLVQAKSICDVLPNIGIESCDKLPSK